MTNLKLKIHTLLRWSERYAKTDMVYLVGQSSWLLLGQIFIFIFSFILAWVFANYLEPAVYGTYKFALTVATLASITSLTGMGTAVARAIASGDNVDLSKIMRLKITAGTVGATAIFGLSIYYLYQGNTELSLLYAILAIWIPFFDSFGDFQYILQGRQKFDKHTLYRIIQRSVVTFCTAISVLLSGDLVVVTFSYFASLTMVSFILWKSTIRQNTLHTPSDLTDIKNFGLKLSAMNVFYIGANHIDKLLIYHFVGPAQLAAYFFAVALPGEVNGMLSNLSTVAFPRLVGKDSHHFKLALLKKISLYVLLLSVPIGIYISMAPWLFNFFFPSYTDAVYITQFFAGTLLFTPFSLLTHYFIASKNERALAVLTIATPATQFITMVILIPVLGVLGAVLAIYTKLIVDTILNLWFFLRPSK